MNRAGQAVIVLAAGGTGGHMFPAEALARELRARGSALALVTDRRGAAFGDATLSIHRIRAGQFVGGWMERVAGFADLARGFVEARRILRELAPAAVVGFGGYASAPTVLAALRAGIPTLIHEQNAVLGRANRLLALRVDAIALSFEETAALPARAWTRARCTGNPVRPAIAALAGLPYPAPVPNGPLEILVTGGSQGASVFAEVLPRAAALLSSEQRARLRIVQQCRAEDLEAAAAAYRVIGAAARLRTFFDDIPDLLARAQLVICRSGASTVAEITAAGRPAILVPYPFAMDDHQTANARVLAGKGAAWLMPQPEFTPAALAARLAALLEEPARLVELAARARAAGVPDAAARLADMVAEIAGNGGALGRGAREEAA